MNRKLFISAGLFLACIAAAAQTGAPAEKEEQQGWELLFNGTSLSGWTSPGKEQPPATGWTIENGVLTVRKENGKRTGDIMTKEQFRDFELKVEFKLTPGANSGIKYFFTSYEKGGWLGLEYQLIDNETHPDAKAGRNGNRRQAALYDMFAPKHNGYKPAGEWNEAHIVAGGSRVTHFLNGKKALSFDRKSKAYRKACERSKYQGSLPPFGSVEQGHILLQDHGDTVSFRNIRIRRIQSPSNCK